MTNNEHPSHHTALDDSQQHERPVSPAEMTGACPKRQRFFRITALVLLALFGLDPLSSIGDINVAAIVFDIAAIFILIWFYRKNNRQSSSDNSVSQVHNPDIAVEEARSFKLKNETSLVNSLGGTALLIMVLIFARAIGGAIGDWTRSASDDPSAAVQNLLTDESFKEYVASDFGFKADFPGFPAKESDTLRLEGYDVSYTMYSREIENGVEAYMAIVYDYSNLPPSSSELSLEGAINGGAQNIPNGRVVSTASATLGNHNALEGHITGYEDGSSYDVYARFTVRGMHMYGVMTSGTPYTDFRAFAESFAFTQ